MLLNCDLGEGMQNDAEIIPLIDMANLACGAHAGSVELIRANMLKAKEYGVTIGAHPSYPDRDNFGRVSMDMEVDALHDTMVKQISLLENIAKEHSVVVEYVKPHGALYNDMMKSDKLFGSITKIIAEYNNNLQLMILSSSKNSNYCQIAKEHGVELICELFADRNYTDDGGLVSRGEPNAVIHDVDIIIDRISSYRKHGILYSANGKALKLQGDTLCVHGDTPEALEMIRALRELLLDVL